MSKNIQVGYMYRDGSNYKNSGVVVLANPENIPLATIKQAIESSLDDGSYFIANQVGLPDVFLWERGVSYDPDNPPAGLTPGHYMIRDDDHCWHTFTGLLETDLPASEDVPISIGELVQAFQQASADGWDEFDVLPEESVSNGSTVAKPQI